MPCTDHDRAPKKTSSSFPRIAGLHQRRHRLSRALTPAQLLCTLHSILCIPSYRATAAPVAIGLLSVLYQLELTVVIAAARVTLICHTSNSTRAETAHGPSRRCPSGPVDSCCAVHYSVDARKGLLRFDRHCNLTVGCSCTCTCSGTQGAQAQASQPYLHPTPRPLDQRHGCCLSCSSLAQQPRVYLDDISDCRC